MEDIFLKRLTGRVFKILPFFEEHTEGIADYIESVLIELIGSLKDYKDNEKLKRVIYTLQFLQEFVVDFDDKKHKVVKREVFKCLTLIRQVGEENGK